MSIESASEDYWKEDYIAGFTKDHWDIVYSVHVHWGKGAATFFQALNCFVIMVFLSVLEK